MSIKILIGGGDLADLLAKNPEVELDLTKQAAMQVAEVFKRKLNITALADQMIQRLNREVGTKWGFPPEVQKIINEKAKEAVEAALDSKVNALVNAAVADSVKRYADSIERHLNAKIDAVILDKVTLTLKAAAKLGGKS